MDNVNSVNNVNTVNNVNNVNNVKSPLNSFSQSLPLHISRKHPQFSAEEEGGCGITYLTQNLAGGKEDF